MPGTTNSMEQPVNAGQFEMSWGSDAVAQMLREFGIDYIALNPGASYRGLHDSLVNYLGNRDPKMLVALHEEHAVAIAHGYAKVTDKPMAVAVHSNVGLMHATMAIFNAWCDRVPMLILGATGPMDADKRRPWIEWIHTAKDQGALVRDYIKWDDQPASPEAAVESM
ncbi:MAG: thiamine pyrophosphate-binding protein, partial [Alphaproteobacteria bacterium]